MAVLYWSNDLHRSHEISSWHGAGFFVREPALPIERRERVVQPEKANDVLFVTFRAAAAWAATCCRGLEENVHRTGTSRPVRAPGQAAAAYLVR